MKKVSPVSAYKSEAIIGYTFKCPGCNDNHMVYVNHANKSVNWTFNNDLNKPTFSPSILVRSGHHSQNHKKGDGCWCTYNKEHQDNPTRFTCYLCHSFVRDGKIQFLNDCTHELAGKTVELSEVED